MELQIVQMEILIEDIESEIGSSIVELQVWVMEEYFSSFATVENCQDNMQNVQKYLPFTYVVTLSTKFKMDMSPHSSGRLIDAKCGV